MKNSILTVLPFIPDPSSIVLRDSAESEDLTAEETRLLAFFELEKEVTRQAVERYMNVGKTKAVKLLNGLSNKNRIQKDGSGRSVFYRIKL